MIYVTIEQSVVLYHRLTTRSASPLTDASSFDTLDSNAGVRIYLTFASKREAAHAAHIFSLLRFYNEWNAEIKFQWCFSFRV
jgi:hypothetical protein